MSKRFRISEEEANKVEEFFRKKDDHPEAAHSVRSAISTGSGYIARGRYYDGVEKPTSDSSTISITPSRDNCLCLVLLQHWPVYVNNPVAIIDDREDAKEAMRKVAKEWGFLL